MGCAGKAPVAAPNRAPPARPQGYTVHGIIRRSSSFNTGRIEHLYKDPHQRGVRIL